MSEWKKVRLGDICDILSSKRIFAKEYVREGVSFFRGKEIIEKQKGNKVSTELFITRERYEELKSKSGVPSKGDILLTSVGTLGVPWVVTNEKFYFKDGNLTWFRNFNNIDSTFLYYWILSPKAKDQIDQKCIGSTQRALTIETLRKFEINLPPLEEQERIAKILGSLDDKIELNNKINRNLEAQAEALFKQWFVDFDFPDPSGNPYRTSGGAMIDSPMGTIPDGWRVERFGDNAIVKRGGSPRPIQEYLSDKGLRWLKISDVTSVNSPFILDIKEHIKESGLSKTTLLNKGRLVLSNSATPGIPKILAVDTCIHDGWLHFPESTFSNEFMYLLFMEIRPNLVLLGNGSVFTNLKTDIVKDHLLAKADSQTLILFDKIIKPLFARMHSIAEENMKLSQIRDSLLPKLMNNEI